MHQCQLMSTCLSPATFTQSTVSATVTSITNASETGLPLERSTTSAARTQTTDTWQYWCLFGRIICRKKTRILSIHDKSREEPLGEEKCLLVKPTFFRTELELRYSGKGMSVPSTLTFHPVLSYREFHESTYYKFRDWDTETWKKAFSHREISPYLRSECGMSMLHAASEYNKADLCLLLIQMGVDPDHTDNKGCKALYYNRNREEFGESPVDTARVLATAQDHLAIEDISESGVDHRQGLPHRTELLWAIGRSSIKGNDWETFFLRLALRYHGSDGMHWGPLIYGRL